MHLEETYTGFMRAANSRDGKSYKDNHRFWDKTGEKEDASE